MDAQPMTGQLMASPAPPGAGWPGDPATRHTPIARDAADVTELAAAAADLAELQAAISVCRACPRLVAWREEVATTSRRASFAHEPYWGRPVPSFGDPAASVLLIGLAPAANGANRTGRMFTGDPSGDFLFAALHRTGFANQPTATGAGDGLVLTGIRLLAPVRCAPPANTPTPEEKLTCRPWLRRDLEFALPTVRQILALGAIGWQSVLATLASLGWQVPHPLPRFVHGARVDLVTPDGRPVTLVGCYHVSPHNTYTGRLTPAMLDDILRSLRAPDPRGSDGRVRVDVPGLGAPVAPVDQVAEIDLGQ